MCGVCMCGGWRGWGGAGLVALLLRSVARVLSLIVCLSFLMVSCVGYSMYCLWLWLFLDINTIRHKYQTSSVR